MLYKCPIATNESVNKKTDHRPPKKERNLTPRLYELLYFSDLKYL